MDEYAVVVLGASAGGIMALPEVLSQLPTDLPAAVFIVQHLYAEIVSSLPQLLNRNAALLALHPRDGQPVEAGKVYVAPPDYHLLIRQPGNIELSRGARENLHRPAIDPLFRTAARCYGQRTIGVLLTGTKDDGVAGLMAVKMRGGIAIVQDPTDAAFREMPQSALEQVDGIDFVAPLSEIPNLIVQSVQRVLQGADVRRREEEIVPEPAIRGNGARDETEVSTLICPECGGGLEMNQQGRSIQYHCHVGHAFGLESLRAAYSEKTEQTLWAALRAFKEQVVLLRQMAARTQTTRLHDEYLKQAQAATEHAEHVQKMLANLDTPTVPGRV
jgi:two-component system, chemotaxis family, protein-glutamate methylesterase/glutaminase